MKPDRLCAFADGVVAIIVTTMVPIAIYVIVALMWLIPDKRFERVGA